MLGPLLMRTLEDTGSFRAVVHAPTGLPADLRLDTELVRLQQNFTGRSRAASSSRCAPSSSTSAPGASWRRGTSTSTRTRPRTTPREASAAATPPSHARSHRWRRSAWTHRPACAPRPRADEHGRGLNPARGRRNAVSMPFKAMSPDDRAFAMSSSDDRMHSRSSPHASPLARPRRRRCRAGSGCVVRKWTRGHRARRRCTADAAHSLHRRGAAGDRAGQLDHLQRRQRRCRARRLHRGGARLLRRRRPDDRFVADVRLVAGRPSATRWRSSAGRRRCSRPRRYGSATSRAARRRWRHRAPTGACRAST